MTPEQTVRDFCEAWGRRDVEEILSFFTDDAVYHNIPIDPAVGKDAIRNILMMFVPPASEISFEVRNLAADGQLVYTERVDRFTIGDRRIELPVMGIFEVADGKIAAWRDYFDLQTFMGQSGG